jgi:hypothetical protein
MAQGFVIALGPHWRLGWAAGAVIVVMLAASKVGMGVTSSPSPLAADRPAPTFGSTQQVVGTPAAWPASLPVEVVLSHVVLTPEPYLPRMPIALPISFGRPIAPEDEFAAPPTRWRHRVRTARHVARHSADYQSDDAAPSTAS